MKLSFVIPAYNEEKSIGACLESVLRQIENKNCGVEIIVVNNASTDRTKEIADSFPGVRVIDEPRKGLSSARQTGFSASCGDLIANIDADTRLTPDWIDKVFKAFLENPKLAAFSGPYIYYDLSKTVNWWVRIFYYFGFIGCLFNKYIFHKGAMLQGGNFVVRKSALQKIGGYNLDFDFYGEDTDIACRLCEAGDVVFTFNLPMYASGRRLKEEGILTMAVRYGINHLWTILFSEPFTKKFKDIRQ